MDINFNAVLADLEPGSLLNLMSAARNDPDYFFTTLLPERNMPDYNAELGNMTVRSTMAGLVGMDSPFPPGGIVQARTFNEKVAKIAISIGMNEETLRTIQKFVREYILQNNGAGAPAPTDFLTGEALNFFNKVVVQGIKDTREWLRGQALLGEIDWTFNNKTLSVDYGFPSANILTSRSGTSAYNGSASSFWTDVKAMRKALRTSTNIIFLCHPDMAEAIVDNPVNSVNVVAQTVNSRTIQKVVGDNRVPTGDARDKLTLITYGLEGEVLDPSDVSVTVTKEFQKDNKLLAIGNGNNRAYRVGQGSSEDPINDLELGYTHLAPTIEGNGAMGDWGRMFTPEARPMQLQGEGVSNCLPVIERYNAVVVGTSTIS